MLQRNKFHASKLFSLSFEAGNDYFPVKCRLLSSNNSGGSA